jgi:hypothetical protein
MPMKGVPKLQYLFLKKFLDLQKMFKLLNKTQKDDLNKPEVVK